MKQRCHLLATWGAMQKASPPTRNSVALTQVNPYWQPAESIPPTPEISGPHPGKTPKANCHPLTYEILLSRKQRSGQRFLCNIFLLGIAYL